MANNDHAILVGINRYPELGDNGSSLDLKGPINDVDAVKQWLLSPTGGGFPDDSNIDVVKSDAAAAASTAHPTADELETILGTIDKKAVAQRNATGDRVIGRRLYLFMTGHGFSPARQRACLFTANAQERLSFNVHATGWLNWFQDAGYFREFVLWMDCCMNRLQFLPPRDPQLPVPPQSDPPRANFIAFAAQRPLRAVEAEVAEDGGKVHGLFTWALLEGLRGAAADRNGRVTGRSLADWIRNAQSARMAQADLDNTDVAKEPDVIAEDAGLIFARGVPKPAYAVNVSFPAEAIGKTARLWSGAPPRVVQSFPIGATPEKLSLTPGLYLIDAPEAGIAARLPGCEPYERLDRGQRHSGRERLRRRVASIAGASRRPGRRDFRHRQPLFAGGRRVGQF